jgi:hypothetical protein
VFCTVQRIPAPVAEPLLATDHPALNAVTASSQPSSHPTQAIVDTVKVVGNDDYNDDEDDDG